MTNPTSTAVPALPAWVEEFPRFRFHHATARFGGARGMDILTFQQRVVEAYTSVIEQLKSGSTQHLVRFWAFVPGMHDDLGAGLDRYMAFNAGRFAAFAAHCGRPDGFGRSVPTASAVGVEGDEFVLHGLAADHAGVAVENPRQVSAYHYSRRFGPMPPCFARATLLGAHTDEPVLIVGGTASITGEESRHLDNLPEQADETLRNLASVVASATGGRPPADTAVSELAPLLSMFRALRVYHTRLGDQEAISALLQRHFPSSCRVELLHASLCRQELLIEIEGIAVPRRGIGTTTIGPARVL